MRNRYVLCIVIYATSKVKGRVYICLKFIHSEKTTKFCKTSTVDLSYVVSVKSTVEISENFVAFSEYMNFNRKDFFDN